MVATVLRLRFRILGNSITQSPWRMLGFIAGALGAIWILVLIVGGLIALSMLQGLEITSVVMIFAGSLLLLGWTLGPLLVSGTDQTVDAVRLAPYPISIRQIMVALTAVGLTGVPGMVAVLAALTTVIAWWRWPGAAVVAVPCALLAVLTCVVSSRYVATLSMGLKRGREVIGTVALIALMLTGPIIAGLTWLASRANRETGESLATVALWLGWSPVGAPWAVPGDVAAGAWLQALAKFAIAAATLVVVWMLWARTLQSGVSAPDRTASKTKPGQLGWFGMMPTGPVGATWARSTNAWLRDPRYRRQLILLPVMPVLFGLTTGIEGFLFLAAPMVGAFIMAMVAYAEISYDGTAFASVLSTGIRGRDDRLGRMLGAVVVPGVLMLVMTIAVVAVSGRWDLLVAQLAGVIGIVLVGLGVCAVSSALIVTPVPQPGDSPFKTVPGQTFLTGLLAFLPLFAVMLLAAPAVALSAVSMFTGNAGLAWIALATGLVVGALACGLGVWIGGRTLDRTGPTLLARIKAFPR